MPVNPLDIIRFIRERNVMRAEARNQQNEREQEWLKTYSGFVKAGTVSPQRANMLYRATFGKEGPFSMPKIGETVTKTPQSKGMFGTETTILPGKEVRTGGYEVPKVVSEMFKTLEAVKGMKGREELPAEAPEAIMKKYFGWEKEKEKEPELAKTVWQRFFQINPDATMADILSFTKELAENKDGPTEKSVTELDNLARGLFPGKNLKTLSSDERLYLARHNFEQKKMNMLAVLFALRGEEGGLGGLFERPTAQELKEAGKKKEIEQWAKAEEDEFWDLVVLRDRNQMTAKQEERLAELVAKRKRLKVK